MNYIILNDVNSNTLTGLIIQNLPPITKPKIRTNTEEIDGRDGDIVTKLGYSSYTKEFDIGLSYNYDVDDIIAFFNSEGTVVFSNESDKYYRYTIIEQIDFEKLIRFKTAKVKMHVQPFKYSNTDGDIEIYATETDAEGTNITIDNTENGASFLDMQLKGQTSQTTYTGKNLFPRITFSQTINGVTITATGDGTIKIKGTATGSGVNHSIWGAWASSTTLFTLPAGTYTASGIGTRQQSPRINIVTNGTTSIFVTNTTQTLETNTNVTGIFVWVNAGTTVDTTFKYQIEKGSTATTYEPYTNGASPNPSYPQNIDVTTGDVTITIANSDSSTTQSYTISLGDEELCKIGNYQDYIYYDDGWYIHKEVEKLVLDGTENWTTRSSGVGQLYEKDVSGFYPTSSITMGYSNQYIAEINLTNDNTWRITSGNKIAIHNGTIGSLSNFKTFLSSNNLIIYYPLATATDTEITDETLLEQLEELRSATTYEGQTNITTDGSLAPIFYGKTYTTESSSVTVTNSGNIYSKPVVTITGIGTIALNLNDYQVFNINFGDTETSITIDVENMEAYNTNTNVLMNRYVTGDYSNFLFSPGTNTITWSGTIAAIEVTNYSRWI